METSRILEDFELTTEDGAKVGFRAKTTSKPRTLVCTISGGIKNARNAAASFASEYPRAYRSGRYIPEIGILELFAEEYTAPTEGQFFTGIPGVWNVVMLEPAP